MSQELHQQAHSPQLAAGNLQKCLLSCFFGHFLLPDKALANRSVWPQKASPQPDLNMFERIETSRYIRLVVLAQPNKNVLLHL
jgi:hypothetical protein